MTDDFRDRAAIAIYTMPLGPNETISATQAVAKAQELADAVCKAWGHDLWHGDESCHRCGTLRSDISS